VKKMAKRLFLEEEHKKLNPRFIEFSGWIMPLEYTGIIIEHLHVRQKAGIFDISHMGRIRIRGKNSSIFLQKLTSNDIQKLYKGKAQYSLILSPQGTILDDVILYMIDENDFLLVVNAGNREKILSWLHINLINNVEIEDQTESTVLIALQGPISESILNSIVKDNLSSLKYYHFLETEIFKEKVYISRTGYTGEDGFEIFISNKKAIELWNYLINKQDIIPCGLGARDTLRLEMGYPLYGNELDENTTPWEANLSWVVKLDKSSDFIGRNALIELKEKKKKYLIAFETLEGIPRKDFKIFHNNEEIGWVTSGTFSPSLKKGIGLCYLIKKDLDNLELEIRGKRVKIKVTDLPFIKNTSLRKGGK
jgi:aminomethyltransferase